ncbi:MAG: radical SAM protein [Deltaproteobacteria bacterium]|nr:radical SAM protein [Deltaproteobacteria bacterium]
MAKVIDSYHEVGFFRPWFHKLQRIGLNSRYWVYRMNWWLVNKLHYVTRFPIHMDIESTNFCNLKCTMCPHSLDDFGMAKGFFDFELYKRIVAEGSQSGLKSLKLNIRGEPLMNKRLVDMVAFAKDRGILEVMFNTNGLLLSPQKTRELSEARLDYLIVSIDGATKETYERIRVGGDFNLLKSNIEYFIQYRKEKRLAKPLIRLQYVEMRENTHEVKPYLVIWRGKVDVMTVNRYSNRVNCEDRSLLAMKPVGRANCYHPWRRLSIDWSGNAQICCGDWQNLCVLGNCRERTIYEMWHSQQFNEYRRKLKARRLNEIPCCKNCFVLASYRWEKA